MTTQPAQPAPRHRFQILADASSSTGWGARRDPAAQVAAAQLALATQMRDLAVALATGDTIDPALAAHLHTAALALAVATDAARPKPA